MNKKGLRLISCLSLVLLLIICGLLHWYGLTKEHNWGGDFAAYIMQAQSIVEGQPQEFIESSRITHENSSRKISPLVYPWGFPMLLAPIYAYSGLNMLAMKGVNIVFYILFLVLLWFGFKKKQGGKYTIIIIALFALNPYFMHFANNILSDIPFLFFSTLVVLLIEKTLIEKCYLISETVDHLLIGLIIALTFFLRPTGFLLLLVLGITQLIKIIQESSKKPGEMNLSSILKNTVRNWKLYLSPYIVFLVIAILWSRLFPGGSTSHFDVLSGITLEMVRSHLVYYIRIPVDFFSGVPFRNIVYCGSLVLVIIGVVSRYKTEYHILIYAAMLLILHLLWPDLQGIRFIFPILPFYIFFVITGLQVIQDNVSFNKNAAWRLICIIPLIYVLFFFGKVSFSMALENTANNRKELTGPYADTSQELFAYISEHIDQESVIIFFKPRVLRLFTGRPSIMINDISTINRGDYLCLYLLEDSFEQVRVGDMENKVETGQAELIYTNPDFYLYRLKMADRR